MARSGEICASARASIANSPFTGGPLRVAGRAFENSDVSYSRLYETSNLAPDPGGGLFECSAAGSTHQYQCPRKNPGELRRPIRADAWVCADHTKRSRPLDRPGHRATAPRTHAALRDGFPGERGGCFAHIREGQGWQGYPTGLTPERGPRSPEDIRRSAQGPCGH